MELDDAVHDHLPELKNSLSTLAIREMSIFPTRYSTQSI